MTTKITEQQRADLLAELRAQNAALLADPETTGEHAAADAAYLMDRPDAWAALEALKTNAAEVPDATWAEMLGITEKVLDWITDDLYDLDLMDFDLREGTCFYFITDRGREALEAAVKAEEAAALETAAEQRRKRRFGWLTIEDVWTHDVLLEAGPLTWEDWESRARPVLYDRRVEELVKRGECFTRDEDGKLADFVPPSDDPAYFVKSAHKLQKRGHVERRKDGTYASVRPHPLQPEEAPWPVIRF
jgi:hypothetical protein